ncbi:MAG: glycosyltransferase [Chloroflexi bacterium]|nr:glycosyltransferase [Chloroflexota bacterium]
MRLAIVYHRPFYRDPSGGLWEAEGAFSRYVESLARRVDEVVLCVPQRLAPFGSNSYRLAAANVRLYPLPFFDRLPRFYAGLPTMLSRLWRGLPSWDLVNLRIPTPLGIYAYALARLRRRQIFLLVVGDLAGVAASVPVDSPKRALYRAYLWLEERLQDLMVSGAPSFVNGRALYVKYNRAGRRVLLTTTSTISRADIGNRPDTCAAPPIRLLCVSRIDPRKGLRYLPEALAELIARGHDVRLTILGPVVGTLGAEEQGRIAMRAASTGVADRIELLGQKTLLEVLGLAREHDLFVLPTLPGEGVPRVLLEAMASGLPIVASDVAGVPTLIAHGVNGLLVPPADPPALAAALDRLIRDPALRQHLIANAYTVARAHTAEAHADKIALGLVKLAGIHLRRERGPAGSAA